MEEKLDKQKEEMVESDDFLVNTVPEVGIEEKNNNNNEDIESHVAKQVKRDIDCYLKKPDSKLNALGSYTLFRLYSRVPLSDINDLEDIPPELERLEAVLADKDTREEVKDVVRRYITEYTSRLPKDAWHRFPKNVQEHIASFLSGSDILSLMRSDKISKTRFASFLLRPFFAHLVVQGNIQKALNLYANNKSQVMRISNIFKRQESPLYMLAHQGPAICPENGTGELKGTALYAQLCKCLHYQDNTTTELMAKVHELMYFVTNARKNEGELKEVVQTQAESLVRMSLKTHKDFILVPSDHFGGMCALQLPLAEGDIHMVEDLLRPHLIDSEDNAYWRNNEAKKHDAKIQAHIEAKDTVDDKTLWNKQLLELAHQKFIATFSILLRGLHPDFYTKVRMSLAAVKDEWLFDFRELIGLCKKLIDKNAEAKKNDTNEAWGEVGKIICQIQTLIRTSLPRNFVQECLFNVSLNNDNCCFADAKISRDLLYGSILSDFFYDKKF